MRLLAGAIVLLSLLTASFQEDPFDIQQRALSESITAAWDSIWNDCNTYVRRPIRNRDDARRYMECMFGNLPDYIRRWTHLNSDAIKDVREILQNFFAQNMPDGSNDAKREASIANVAVYAHKKTSAWHQRFAQMIIKLGNVGLLDGKETKDLLRMVQESMNASTSTVRALVADIQAGDDMDPEAVAAHIDTYLTTFESSTKRIVEVFQTKCLNAVSRAERHYPTLLARDNVDYNKLIEGYDEFFNNTFQSLNHCAGELWEAPEQSAP